MLFSRIDCFFRTDCHSDWTACHSERSEESIFTQASYNQWIFRLSGSIWPQSVILSNEFTKKKHTLICNLKKIYYNIVVITMRLYGSSNCYLVGATFFLYSNFDLKLLKESIFSLAVFFRKIEYFFSFGTININNLFFL